MITLTIDNQPVQAPDGSTILEAAERAGIHIPTLCYAKGFEPSTSCMVCVVRVEGYKQLMPACGTRAAEHMHVTTRSDEIDQARKAAIELLLSDHVGDCVGPCMVGCPANMNIPQMIRQIAAGRFKEAIKTVKRDIPLPAILGRICPAPCEKVCRRGQADAAVSICLLKRFVADVDLEKDRPCQPECRPSTGKKVAIIGAGPCGLSAAYYLKQAGIDCVLYDEHDKPGGALRYAEMDRAVLPVEIADREISQLLSIGIEFKGNIRVGKDVSIQELKSQYDAVFIAAGDAAVYGTADFGVEIKENKVQVDRQDYSASEAGIFAGGGCIGSRHLCIRAVADGKEAAFSIESFLLGKEPVSAKAYNHRMGKLETEEMAVFLKQASEDGRHEPEKAGQGLNIKQAQAEAQRCLHCDCRKLDDCRLRQMATDFQARQKRFAGEKKLFRQIINHEQIVYEPGKCIKCGLCIQAAMKEGERLGLSFEGRGFETEVVIPLGKEFACGLVKSAQQCADICPTGALALKNK